MYYFIKNIQIQNNHEINHLKRLNELNIDLTEYLIGSIEKTDKLIKIVNKNVAGTHKDGTSIEKSSTAPNIHFHE